mmetsp:Transcript_16275/g.37229  ORF Transcript_16275/g.37229 Transcript_16275/m.37229 type:complete len:311 (-) Transcript_16275:81-1013(-)
MDYSGIGAEKVAALLCYFQHRLAVEGTADDDRIVRWEHLETPASDEMAAQLEACEAALVDESACPPSVLLHSGVMEAAPRATAFVNFANAQFGYGCFINSCTQEEILQVCCPEFNVGMLWLGTMRAGEAVVVRGCRRYARYSGYLGSFRCEGMLPAKESVVQDVLTLDACTSAHFEPRQMLRDIAKAVAAFRALGPVAVVSTGRWGCGVFGGLPSHKFMQQMLAARLAGVPLEFSTFGSPDGCDTLLAALSARQISVSSAWRLMLTCRERATFEASILLALNGSASASEPAGSVGRCLKSVSRFLPSEMV